MIISGFPCIGKSTLSKTDKNIIDLESSIFKKDLKNYLKMIVFFHSKDYIVLCSSHKEVRQELKDNGIDYVYVKPNIEDKEFYRQRSNERQPHPLKTEILMGNWDSWLQTLPNENVKILPKGGYIDYKVIEEIQNGMFEKNSGDGIDFIENIITIDLDEDCPFPSMEVIANFYPDTLIVGIEPLKKDYYIYLKNSKKWRKLNNKNDILIKCKDCKSAEYIYGYSGCVKCKEQNKVKSIMDICDNVVPQKVGNKILFTAKLNHNIFK